MKKTAFVLVTALVLVFAFTASAMATAKSGTIPWDSAAPNDNPVTPHKGYAYNTQKCLVCHAVHKANPAGEVLLGDTVGNACNYCHVANPAISSKVVYGGDADNLLTDTAKGHEKVSCTGCHAVHGANTVNQSALSSKILKANIETAQTGPGDDTWDMASGSELGALSAYCTQCHPYYVGTYAGAGVAGDITDDNYSQQYGSTNYGPDGKGTYATNWTWNSHIMTAVDKDLTSYNPGNNAVQTGDQVAWAGTPYCTSCHDAGRKAQPTDLTDPDDSFPHMTVGARFMKSAEHAGVGTPGDAVSATEDGVCLKCHRGAADSGVQFDF